MRAAPWLVFGVVALVACSCDAAAPPTTSLLSPSTLSTSPSSVSTTVGSTTTIVESTTSAPLTTVKTRPLSGAIIVVDPGHNGMNWAHPDEIGRLVDIGNGTKPCNTTGTSTAKGYTEAEFNWAVAQLVVTMLEDAGATVTLTRPDNDGWGPCISERAATGNRNQADAVVSIHADGGPEDGRGFHVIHPATVPGLTDDIAAASRRLAEALHAAYLDTGMPVADYIGQGGFSERDDLGGLNLSDVPAVFLETGNMRNLEDAALLVDPLFQRAVADAIVEAMVAFLAR